MSSLQNLSEHVAIRASVSPLRTGNPLFSPGCHLPHVPSPQTEGIQPTGQLQVQAVALISVLLTPPCPSGSKEELVPRLVPSPTGLFSDFEVPCPSVPRPLPRFLCLLDLNVWNVIPRVPWSTVDRRPTPGPGGCPLVVCSPWTSRVLLSESGRCWAARPTWPGCGQDAGDRN